MTEAKILIVNADDFGFSRGVNGGIIQAHEQGIVTSASLMVRGAAVDEAIEYARSHARLSVGLHIDLGEWSYSGGQWLPRYTVVSLADAEQVRTEVERQLALFRSYMQRNPTHIDSHQHVHRDGAAHLVATEIAKKLGVPLRHYDRDVRHCGHFYGQPSPGISSPSAVSAGALLEIIGTLEPGITELACHPGSDEQVTSDYVHERSWETAALCAPEVHLALASANILLRSFSSDEVRNRSRTLSSGASH